MPEAVALGLAGALELAVADAELAAEEEEEDDDELLQPTAASPTHAMPSSAANRAPEEDRKELSIPRR